ncbi:MAG: substrate-binding domain-containing protein [Alphaproteobacteria bacterium]|nr:substrate-binding domain-containing protein [Alphaproteobacteria bacterium]
MNQLVRICFMFSCLILACEPNQSLKKYDTANSGTIYISVEESFEPVFKEQIRVFESLYPEAKIIASYKSEIECIKDLKFDSIRLVIVSRDLSDNEFKTVKKNIGYAPRSHVLAYSAISVLIPKDATDSFFDYLNLENILSGQRNVKVVVDKDNSSATNMFLIKHILKNRPFGKNVKAATSNDSILSVLTKKQADIGFIAYNWINDSYYNKSQQAILKKLKFAAIACEDCPDSLKNIYTIPSPNTIQKGLYPLRVPIYYILKENRSGLGSGFINYLSLENGQLVFKKSVLLPAQINFNLRQTSIN